MREVVTNTVGAPPFRLPDTIRPQHYTIEIEPDLGTNTFQGRAAIQLHVNKSTRYIVFHTLQLDITEVTVEPEGGIISHPEVHYNPEQETAYLELENKLLPGSQVLLVLRYGGRMSLAGSSGLSPSPYQFPDGSVKLGFVTMFQPTAARLVFPCFDEPDLKAEFVVSMVVPSDLTCLSNMEVASEELIGSSVEAPKKRVVFETSPKMSTYLVVYFNVVETNDYHVPIRIWASLDKDIQMTSYALETAVKVMQTLEKDFGLKYPLPKLDMVAVPGFQG
jgi:aminopeptidase 2